MANSKFENTRKQVETFTKNIPTLFRVNSTDSANEISKKHKDLTSFILDTVTVYGIDFNGRTSIPADETAKYVAPIEKATYLFLTSLSEKIIALPSNEQKYQLLATWQQRSMTFRGEYDDLQTKTTATLTIKPKYTEISTATDNLLQSVLNDYNNNILTFHDLKSVINGFDLQGIKDSKLYASIKVIISETNKSLETISTSILSIIPHNIDESYRHDILSKLNDGLQSCNKSMIDSLFNDTNHIKSQAEYSTGLYERLKDVVKESIPHYTGTEGVTRKTLGIFSKALQSAAKSVGLVSQDAIVSAKHGQLTENIIRILQEERSRFSGATFEKDSQGNLDYLTGGETSSFKGQKAMPFSLPVEEKPKTPDEDKNKLMAQMDKPKKKEQKPVVFDPFAPTEDTEHKGEILQPVKADEQSKQPVVTELGDDWGLSFPDTSLDSTKILSVSAQSVAASNGKQ